MSCLKFKTVDGGSIAVSMSDFEEEIVQRNTGMIQRRNGFPKKCHWMTCSFIVLTLAILSLMICEVFFHKSNSSTNTNNKRKLMDDW